MSGAGGSIVRRDAPAALARAGRGDRLLAGAEGVSEFLVFLLGAERMGMPLASVRELLKMMPVTEVPRAPHDVLGILSVRGRITTVLDLRRRLGMPSAAPTRQTRILLVAGDDEVMGLVVDAVLHVARLRADEIEPADVVAADLPDHVIGLGRPRRGKHAHRGAPAAPGIVRGVEAASDASETDVIVLLDPIPLLRR